MSRFWKCKWVNFQWQILAWIVTAHSYPDIKPINWWKLLLWWWWLKWSQWLRIRWGFACNWNWPEEEMRVWDLSDKLNSTCGLKNLREEINCLLAISNSNKMRRSSYLQGKPSTTKSAVLWNWSDWLHSLRSWWEEKIPHWGSASFPWSKYFKTMAQRTQKSSKDFIISRGWNR